MSAFVWLDEPRKGALKSIIEVMGYFGQNEMTQPLQDMLDEAEKSEEFKIQDMFTIKGV